MSALGLAAFAVVTVAVPQDEWIAGFFNVWVYNALMLLACVIAGSRAFTVERDGGAWKAITFALCSWAFGELWYAIVEPQSFPSMADAGYIGFYILVYIGMVLLVRTRARSIGGTLLLDGLTASLAAGALGAAVLVELVLRTTRGSLSTVATNLAYPIGDILLLSAVFGVFSLTRWRPGRVWLLLGLGMLVTALADSVYLFQTAAGTYVQGTWLDILWPTAMLLIANAAWVGEERTAELEVEGRPLLAVPATCALVVIAVLVYDHFGHENVLAVVLATATLLTVVLRLAVTFRENRRLFELTRHEAITDPLTGLGNRRKLMVDLERRLESEPSSPVLVTIFDLDGFKGYNDSFGHPSGDALLVRLGGKLSCVGGEATEAYRLGGDEFCLVGKLPPDEVGTIIDAACVALSEHGEGFQVTSSFGAVLLPEDASTASEALRLADERLYAQKYSRRGETDRSMHAFLEALAEREPDLLPHVEGVGALAVEIGGRLGLRADELDELSRAAQLHDLGKLAVPDEILSKPGPLDEREWAFILQHTVVGERILRASLAFRSIAGVVRSSHERWDGRGYPDGLAGDQIPLASRIIFACDAYAAMISGRSYRRALSVDDAIAELERCAGTQFDPTVVRVLTAHIREGLEAEHVA